MSHRDDCPTREEAEARGRRSFNAGLHGNPYRDDGCEDAESDWRRGHNAAARRAEEQREEQEYLYRMEERDAQERSEAEAAAADHDDPGNTEERP